MKLLAIDTSTMFGGIAIMDDSEGLIVEARLSVKTTHSERLMTEINHALSHSGISIQDIDVFGLASGPGSFTGLRIALSTIKGFCYSTGKSVVSVPTLEAHAWNFPFSPIPVCIMLDARKKEVYAAVFRWEDNRFVRVIGETSVRPAELIKKLEQPVLFAGEGAKLYREEITSIAGENAVFPPLHYMVPSPSNVAYLGLKKALAGEFSDPMKLVPLYIRRSEAEVKMG